MIRLKDLRKGHMIELNGIVYTVKHASATSVTVELNGAITRLTQFDLKQAILREEK
jgi:translation elongation factor P/translation initiation factor 5A